jgi:Arc/MetJ-type ribon-helix-helix transcriptional regulator
MKIPIRTTIALDEKSAEILDSLKSPNSSQSDVIRRALKFYNSFRELGTEELENLKVYSEMLSGGEHIILDLDHFISFLGTIEGGSNQEKFWEVHRTIARNHAEQFRNMDVEQILKRLEACNFFRLVRSGEDNTLIFGNDSVKKFMRIFLEEIFKDLHKEVEIKDDLSKLRVKAAKKLK